MYFVLTAAEVVFLLFGGMNLYDALLHAFSTAGTGGFSNRAASVSFYDSAYIDGVITVFMILFGINFNLYFFILLKDWKSILKNEELWAYLGIVGVSIAIITGNILKIYGTVAHAFRYASFQVGSYRQEILCGIQSVCWESTGVSGSAYWEFSSVWQRVFDLYLQREEITGKNTQ